MLGFIQNWFAPRANPIGVDFGSDCLRLAQVQFVNGEPRLIAAASADVPTHVRSSQSARLAFFVETTRDLLAQGRFQSRQAVLALPAAAMHIQHLRMARLSDEETRKALAWEARGKLPIDPSQALLRHIIAGEVYHDQEPQNEVIVMAASRQFIEQFLASAAKARLDVIGMNVEPKALVDCFGHIYRRKTDAETVNCFLDIGLSSSRAVIARGQQIFFARTIPIGGEHFNRAVAMAMRISMEEAKLLRIKLCHSQVPGTVGEDGRRAISVADLPPGDATEQTPDASGGGQETDSALPLLDAGLQACSRHVRETAQLRAAIQAGGAAPARPLTAAEHAAAELAQQARQVEQACREPLKKLAAELDLCRRYYESTFPSAPVQRLIFVGGEARQRALCQHIAREMGLAAQVGDPLVRMGRISDVGMESGIDRRQPQPGWAVAIGLSLGPVHVGELPPAGSATSGRAASQATATGSGV
jgi:type IV pilus assembly protein PilM